MNYFRDMAVNPLLLSSLIGGLLAAVACGAMGPYVVTRRMVSLAGAIAHIVIGGLGGVIFLRYLLRPHLDGLQPLYGAVVAAVLAAVLIGLVQRYARERLDTLLGALWAIGMATGLMLIKYTPGYQEDLLSYLFGNLAVVDWSDVLLVGVLDIVILAVLAFCHKRFMALCLDEEFVGLQGVRVLATDILLLALVALAVVALTRIVGLILVLALLALPAATAAYFARRMGMLMLLSVLLCAVLVCVPRVAVYGTRVAPESAIVLAAGLVYLLAALWRGLRHKRRTGKEA